MDPFSFLSTSSSASSNNHLPPPPFEASPPSSSLPPARSSSNHNHNSHLPPPPPPPTPTPSSSSSSSSSRVLSMIERFYPRRYKTVQPIPVAIRTSTSTHNNNNNNKKSPRPEELPRRYHTPCVSILKAGGVFWQLRYNFESLVEAAARQDTAWTPGPVANSYAEDCSWQMHEVWNVDLVRSYFAAQWLSSSSSSSQALLPSSSSQQLVSPPCDHCDCFHASLVNKAAWETVMVTVQPASWIADLVDRATPKEAPFVCLHPRVESDFQNAFQRTHLYRSAEQIMDILRLYFRSDEWRTLRAKVGKEEEDEQQQLESEGHQRRRRRPTEETLLYVAGGVNPAMVAALVDQDHFFSRIVSKNDLFQTLTDEERKRASRGAPATIIDSFVCQRAMLHIGTSGSIWDEWVYGVRRLHEPPLPSLRYAGHTEARLIPFVGNNDGRFFLTAEERAQLLR